ncbi:MAG: T9SS type A sorting domain-containing protein [Bacteroidota bacterium]
MTSKITLSYLITLFPLFFTTYLSAQCDRLVLTAVFDGPVNNAPRGVELYATEAIPNLGIYGIGSANNGEGSDGMEFTFPTEPVAAGTFIYVAFDSTSFHDFFGFAANFAPESRDAVGFLNGDDAVELFCNNTVVDVFGDLVHGGSGLNWNYENGWAYRLAGTGSDGTTFQTQNWNVRRNALNVGALQNGEASHPLPIGTFDTFPACDRLVITGIYDGTLPGREPQGIEMYTTRAISDLNLFGFGSANNGGGSDGQELTFPTGTVAAGSFLYVTTDSTDFHNFFGFAPTVVSPSATVNGDDAVELFCQAKPTESIDVFGDINKSGTGEPWDYTRGWAYRKNQTGPDGTNFILSNWIYGGVNALEGGTNNQTANTPFPLQTFNQGCPENSILPAGNLASGDYQAVDTLRATATVPVGNTVNFTAGKAILLNVGFAVESGGQFSAKIENCSVALALTKAPEATYQALEFGVPLSNQPAQMQVSVYPNPTKHYFSIDLRLIEKEPIQIALMDKTGKFLRVLLPQQTVANGMQRFNFAASDLSTGLYWIRVISSNNILMNRLVVLK